MKQVYEFAVATGIFFALFFDIFTLGFNVSDPSIGMIKIVRYGFPLSWLKAVITILPPAPTHYMIFWFELLVDVVFCLALSMATSFILINVAKRFKAPSRASLPTKVLLIVLAACPTRILSCFIHEFLGHGLWAWIFGAYNVQVYVSWLGFGSCSQQGMSSSFVARVLFSAGGLLNTFIIGALILASLYLVPKKGGFYLRFSLFWLGFWAAINQASYLILSGLTSYGDPVTLSSLTGIPLVYFAVLGIVLFLVVYLMVSVLFLLEVTSLFPEYRKKMLLFAFWLSIPIQVILFALSPQHVVSTNAFLLLFITSTFPSLISLRLFPIFDRLRNKRVTQ